MLSSNFKPQHTTSLATVRHYTYTDEPLLSQSVRELRFGTQGQRHDGQPRIAPLFKQYLRVQSLNTPEKITHIYFNNLGRDLISGGSERILQERKKESELTSQLEMLEKDFANVAVITLPAEKGILSKNGYRNSKKKYKYEDVRTDFLNIALENGQSQTKPKDFYISQSIRKQLFGDKDKEKMQLEALIDSSFEAVGIDHNTILSDAERQAVYFHFIKFELPNFILNKFKPETFNFSCKDAIDREGVSSAYYNLIKSFEDRNRTHSENSNKPMSEEEFNRALHAAPTMVKGRGMNEHINLIWNAVDAYINNPANFEVIDANVEKKWLIQWRDMNCPHERVQELLNRRVVQCKEDLKAKLDKNNSDVTIQNENKELLQQGIAILDQIEGQVTAGVSGKRLLLEAVTRTHAMTLDSISPNSQKKQNPDSISQYEHLACELKIKYPSLKVLGGAMKVFAGFIIKKLTFSHIGQHLYEKGKSTFQAGMLSGARNKMVNGMVSHQKNLKSRLSELEKRDQTQTKKTEISKKLH